MSRRARGRGRSTGSYLYEIARVDRADRLPSKLFTDAEGRAWRVYDRTVVDARPITVPVGDRRAVYRVFVSPTRERRRYRFSAREDHGPTAAALEQQLAQAIPLQPAAR